MKRIPLGNDLIVDWTIVNQGSAYNLEGKDLNLTVIDMQGKKAFIPEFSVSSNILSFTFYGKDQKTLGQYTLKLEVNKGKEDMHTTDVVDAFSLVPHSIQAGGEDTCSHISVEHLNLQSALGVGAKGDPGDPAGFGTVTASVDANTGIPYVEVTTSGPDTEKNFSFAFHNLKGQDGSSTGQVQSDWNEDDDESPAYILNKPTIPGPEIFWATYGTTTAAEIDAAVAAGKTVMCYYSNRNYALCYYDASASLIYFGSIYESSSQYISCRRSNNTWSSGIVNLERTNNRVTSWQATPDDTHYPSEKLVKDSLDGKQPTIDANNKLDYSLLDNAPGVADANNLGLVRVDKNAGGINKDSNGKLILDVASDAEIAAKTTVCALKVRQIDKAVQVGITTNANTLSASEKAAAQAWLGVYDAIHPAVQTSQPAGGFAPNVLYNLGELSGNTTFALATPADANIVNHYYWTFETSSSAPTVTWPAGITSWLGGSAPTISASKHYEISVLGGVGAYMEV